MRAGTRTRHVPVVMYTAHDDDAHRQRAEALGVPGYLVKSAARFVEVEQIVTTLLPD